MRTLLKHPQWLICIISLFIYTVYQSLVITDRFVSKAHIVLNSPTIEAPSLDFGSLLSGTSASSDLLLLRDYMMSVDMLRKLDSDLNLREHYSSNDIDYFSRLKDANAPIEDFFAYYLTRIEVELDEYSKVLRIKAQAFNPNTAHEIVKHLLKEGEKHMNAMGQKLASEQVKFIEDQVHTLAERVRKGRENLIEYQNKHGLVSPRSSVESLSSIVGGLEEELAQLQAKEKALSVTQSNRSASMQELQIKISAIKNQIENERSRMAAQSGNALNRIALEYETLELENRFAQELYSSALSVLENIRVEAVRQLKQISIIQSPTLPEYSTSPRRLYNVTLFAILIFMGTVIVHMLVQIVRDHRD